MSNAVGRAFDPRSGQTKDYKIGICCFSTKHVALRRKSSESGYCIRVGQHVYLTIILEIMHFSVNELKRCLITLHLSLNDLLRRSVDLMRSAYTNHYQTRTIRRNRNSNKIVLSGSCTFRATVLS